MTYDLEALADFFAEVRAKHDELLDQQLKEVLKALLVDAAETFKKIEVLDPSPAARAYPFRALIVGQWRAPVLEKYIERLETSMSLNADIDHLIRDHGLEGRQLPTILAASARRLRVVTAVMPNLVSGGQRGDTRTRQARRWQAMWLYASGMKARSVRHIGTDKRTEVTGWAQLLRRNPDPARPISESERTEAFKTLNMIYSEIAAEVERLIVPLAAA